MDITLENERVDIEKLNGILETIELMNWEIDNLGYTVDYFQNVTDIINQQLFEARQ